jgi:hypothetical protein
LFESERERGRKKLQSAFKLLYFSPRQAESKHFFVDTGTVRTIHNHGDFVNCRVYLPYSIKPNVKKIDQGLANEKIHGVRVG